MSLEPISTAEAAQRLGVTSTTIRRMIASGRLQAVTEPRPQGARFRTSSGTTAAASASPPSGAGCRRNRRAGTVSPSFLGGAHPHLRQRVETAAQHRNQAWQDLER